MSCTKFQRKLCVNDDCKICYNRNFANHEKSKYWDYTKNVGKPEDYCKSAHI